MTIKAIIFDIGGVLEITPSTGWVEKWEKQLRLNLDEVFSELDKMGLDGSHGTCTEIEWCDGLQKITKMNPSQTEEFMNDLWHEYLGTLNTELMEYIQNLRTKYRTAIISNSFIGAREKEEELYHFSEFFDFIVYSHEVGLSKPDPRIFTLACERLGMQPAEIIFVDDHEEAMSSAREMGIHCILHSNNTQTITEIESCIAEQT